MHLLSSTGHWPVIVPPFPWFYGAQHVFTILFVFIQFITLAGHPPPHVYFELHDNGNCGANVPSIEFVPYFIHYLCLANWVAANA